jgi:DNA-binding NtrC family response regulator
MDETGGKESAGPPEARLLVADDEESMRYFLSRSLSRRGFEVEAVENGEAAMERFEARRFDVAILDLKMPGADGIEVLSRIRGSDPEALVIIMTAYGTIRSAVDAMRQGAFDYITKPFEIDELLLLIDRALGQRATLRENRALKEMVDHRTAYGVLIGQSPAMRSVYQTIDMLRESNATVLISGESGTGKELVARAIHIHSERSRGAFVPIDCAALPENLVESELFGHTAGAFTGAIKRKRGLVEQADGGTLFLDEISEISKGTQVKLVRFLQERRFTPLGSVDPVSVDLRIISATNRDLEARVAEDRFRQDLYWRLNVVPIHLPPLRERREDIPLLASHILERLQRSEEAIVKGFTVDAMIVLSCYPWPGNVRELENTIERMVVLHGDQESIGVEDLPQAIRDKAEPERRTLERTGPIPYREALGAFESEYLIRLLASTRGDVTEAARLSGISRPQIHQKIRKLGLDPKRFRE